jgi:hypothetical protein
VDAGAALRPAAIDVTLGEWIYTIPVRPAADWIEAILDEDSGAIVPGLMDEDTRDDVWREFLRGNITKAELDEAWRHALGAASGVPWWQVARLTMSAGHQDSWTIVQGKLAMRGVDLCAISLGAFYNAVYFLGLESCKDESERASFEFSVTSPPPEVSVQEAMEETNAEEDFMSALAGFQQITGGGPAG